MRHTMTTHFKHKGTPARGRSFSSGRGSTSRGQGRSFGRPSYGHQRRSNRSASHGTRIDVSRFIHKTSDLENAEQFVPAHSFMDFNIDPRIKHNIGQKGYATPTPIQDKAIPHILLGRDIVGIANTGTGKTGAFLIPLLDKVVRDRTERVLIMVPT